MTIVTYWQGINKILVPGTSCCIHNLLFEKLSCATDGTTSVYVTAYGPPVLLCAMEKVTPISLTHELQWHFSRTHAV